MPKASPHLRSQNAGEWSVLMEGRTDMDRYPASMRALLNTIVTPQGPSIKRSGTMWQSAVYDEAKHSALVPFVFSEDQSLVLEMANLRMRISTEAGLQVYSPTAVATVVSQVPFQITVPGHGTAIGEQLFLSGFPVDTNKNNTVVNVTAVAGNTLTLSGSYSGATGAIVNAYVSRVYHIAMPYAEADVRNIRYLQSADVMYLFCDGYRNYKLSRFGAYDWRVAAVVYNDGPYMPIDDTGARLTLSATGNMTTGGTATDDTGDDADAARAFDNSDTSYWQSGSDQHGDLIYAFPSPTVINGYIIYPAIHGDAAQGYENDNVKYPALDLAPGNWKLYGNTSASGGTWELLDAQTNYVLWDNGRSVWFKLNNVTGYRQYKLSVSGTRESAPIPCRIARLVFSSDSGPDISATISSIAKLNNGEGWKTTDVDRLIRIKDMADATWRQVRITSRVSTTVVTVKLLSEPFVDVEKKLQWRLGYWSDTTGWPVCGAFFEDRLTLAGPFGTPDLIAMSRTGAYEDFQQTTPIDEVLDDSAVIFRINSRRLSRIRWLADDERGLLIGTGSQEFVVVPANKDQALTARNIRARQSTSRGSANLDPAKVDRQVIFVQTSGRNVREFAYVYEVDGFRSPSMTLFASHMGIKRLLEVDYAGEPHSILWFRREDGSLVGLTYNRDENVVAWHRHQLAGGGLIESMCVAPSAADRVDALWMVVLRTVNSVARRYIERLTRFWDFDMTLTNHAHFVDCAIRYVGNATTVVSGYGHLEGAVLSGLADGIAVSNLVVTNGKVTLSNAASNVILGLQYEGSGVTSRIDAGAGDGTAQGKVKRTHHLIVHLWDSYGGEFGKYSEEIQAYEYAAIEYKENADGIAPPALQTDMLAVDMPVGYDLHGSIAFRSSDPYPFNIVSIMPQLNTQDR